MTTTNVQSPSSLYVEVCNLIKADPRTPKDASEDMIRVATTVANAMIERGFCHGWFGDKSMEFRKDQILSRLKLFVKVSQEGVRDPKWDPYVRDHVANLALYTDMPLYVLETYARYAGYNVIWSINSKGRYVDRLDPLSKKS